MGIVKTFEYRRDKLDKIKRHKYGENWPVVYILRNEKEAYVGESTRVYGRSQEHMKNKDREKLKNIDIIADEDFNKSVTLDYESRLIEFIAADGKYELQNGNGGLQNHNYFDKINYDEKFSEIWNELKVKKIVSRGLFEIKNSEMFKYSPYKALTSEQLDVVETIVKSILNNRSSKHLIQGEPGTGKTIVAIYLVKYLQEKLKGEMKIGLVIPMTSLRSTLKKVFRGISGLSAKMVLGPSEVVNGGYDILIVDEAHRLTRRRNITNMKTFDDRSKELGLNPLECDQLDWIEKSCKHMVICYDMNQSVKPSDIRSHKVKGIDFIKHSLKSQMRVKGGEDYIKYIYNILNEKQDSRKSFSGYDLFMFDDLELMHKKIKEENEKYGLCRMIAGYAWEWKTKKDKETYDIEINSSKFKWNSTNKDWINSENAVNEVGCIHTTQGYDINYAGVILGEEIGYLDGKIVVYKEKYFDKNGKRTVDDLEELKKYIINIYATILTRGIEGTFIYVCDKSLREYFKKYIDTFDKSIDIKYKEIKNIPIGIK